MRQISVGKLYQEGVTKYHEGINFDISDSGCTIGLRLKNINPREVEEIKKGKLKIGMFRKNKVIIILFKFGEMQWSDAPYSIHLSQELTELVIPAPGEGYALTTILIEANTGIVEAMRLTGLPHVFSLELKKEVEKQKELPFENFDKELQQIYFNYKTKDLVKFSNIYNC